MIAALGVLAAACAGPRLPTAVHGETVLTIRGQVKFGPFYLERKDLAGLPRAGFRAVDPAAGREARFDGVALREFVVRKLEPSEGGDVLLFVGRDGLTFPVSAALLRQYRPILADRIDGAEVPLQLAWPNVEQQGLDADPRAALWWVHQVVAVELVAWDKTWGRALRAPPGVADGGRLGASQYLLRCAACHRLRGVGGDRGPALDRAVSRLGADRFVAAVRAHPGWPERVGTDLARGEDVASQVSAFVAATELSAMPPPEEPPPRPRPGQATERNPFAP
jgi:hypothetical protein